MARSDATALKNSGLDKFLYAPVGTELNGSELTILSVLARLGQDPWAEAARWVKQPKATTIDRLTRSIAQMPLAPQALIDAPLTAARLVQLLPSQKIVPTGETRSITRRLPPMPRWLPVALMIGALLFGLAAFLITTRSHDRSTAVQQTTDMPVFK